jgi:hypothetical protein
MTLVFYRHVFEKYSNKKFYENPFSGIRVVHVDRPTDRQIWRMFILNIPLRYLYDSLPTDIKTTVFLRYIGTWLRVSTHRGHHIL